MLAASTGAKARCFDFEKASYLPSYLHKKGAVAVSTILHQYEMSYPIDVPEMVISAQLARTLIFASEHRVYFVLLRPGILPSGSYANSWNSCPLADETRVRDVTWCVRAETNLNDCV